jgi:hypothetical protein
VAGKKKPRDMGLRRVKIKESSPSEKADLHVTITRCSDGVAPLPGEIQPPPGFKLVSLTQAMVEYAWPLLQIPYAEDIDEHEDIDESHDGMWIAVEIWNCSNSGKSGKAARSAKNEIIDKIRKIKGISDQEADELFKKMLERKSFLFPEELQPEGLPFKVMRKVISHLITPFDQGRLTLPAQPIPPDKEDKSFISNLKKLDSVYMRKADYGEYVNIFRYVSKNCNGLFGKWLMIKGVDEFREDLVWLPEIFCHFVYSGVGRDRFVIKSIRRPNLALFFLEFVLEEICVEPLFYTYFPASMKLFYRFLCEKKYLDDPAPIMAAIDEIEPHYIERLRENFG